ncbi:hypothetical protein LAZ67_4001734 [Cordylochernes scorpioides]|uniref:Uncharacterized protein n=1 Tax=Cordylochernes scorpioides TaxID=51811 RepID=A0ABY6KCE2_9ARAC|nr:hypothetical protein LAZ67_4001734 [Cordylochernes scorpioides]
MQTASNDVPDVLDCCVTNSAPARQDILIPLIGRSRCHQTDFFPQTAMSSRHKNPGRPAGFLHGDTSWTPYHRPQTSITTLPTDVPTPTASQLPSQLAPVPPAPPPPTPSVEVPSNGPTAHTSPRRSTAPQPAEPAPPTPHEEESALAVVAPLLPLPAPTTHELQTDPDPLVVTEDEKQLDKIFLQLNDESFLSPLYKEIYRVEISYMILDSQEKMILFEELSPRNKAVDKVVGGARHIIQLTRMNGHVLVGQTTMILAERLIDEGHEIEGVILRTFPFRKRTFPVILGRSVVVWQPFAMELPLSSPAKCELRSVIRFLNAKNNSPVEIHHQLVEVYVEKCMDIKNVRIWCREFNEGRINVHDEQRSGRPSLPESTINRRITLEEIEDGLNEDCSHFSVHKIVSETLGYRKVSARWVDKWLKEAAGEWYNTGITNPTAPEPPTLLRESEILESGEAVDKVVGGARNIIQLTRMNGHVLVGQTTMILAERLIDEGHEIEGVILRTFPFRKRSEKLTIRYLPFYVEDAVIIDALRPYGRVTSFGPKQLKAGEYGYTDGGREAYILFHDGKNHRPQTSITTLPTDVPTPTASQLPSQLAPVPLAPPPPTPSVEVPSNGPTAHTSPRRSTAPQPAEPAPPTPHEEESTLAVVAPLLPLPAPDDP